MKRLGLWVGVGIVLLAVIALIGWGGAYIPPLTSSASEVWSRGKILGVTPVNVRVDVQTTPDGIFLCWVDLNDQLHVAQLGTRGQVISERMPALGTDVPRDPQLAVGPGGEIHLIWRETGGERSLLTYAQLNSTFSVQVDPFFISPVGDKVQSPNLAFNRRGEIEVFWSGQAGIYHTTLNAAGETSGEPVLLVEDGEEISMQVDQKGIFHLAWLQNLGPNKVIYFASFDPDRRDLSQPEEMVQLVLKVGQTVPGLSVGIDTDTGYVLWVIQDSKNVFSQAQYAFFPMEIPRQKKVRDLELGTGGNPQSLWPVRGQFDTLLIALTETVMTEDGPQLQIAIVPLRGEQTSGDQAWAMPGGRMPGSRVPGDLRLVDLRFGDLTHGGLSRDSRLVQDDLPDQYIVTASERSSLRPTLVIDGSGEMHLTWLESGGFGRYQVAYASTAARVREVYDRPTWWDVANRVLEMAMQFFMAVGLTPVLAIYWSLVPLGWLLLYLFVAGREHLTTPGNWVAFGIAILLEVASTYLFYPHRSRMPPLLQWSAPLGTAAIGLVLALLSLRKREEKSLFGAFFVFAIVHGILQVMCFVLVR